MATTVGLDIGGANLKAADSDGRTRNWPFPMWREKDLLATNLRQLLSEFPPVEHYGVTMTGELADCFENRLEGVRFICQTCQDTLGTECLFYQSTGQFVSARSAIHSWQSTAAANWHATAHWLALHVPSGFLIDIGSTTTDLIPFHDGLPLHGNVNDLDRLSNHELLYTGISRTPLCSLLKEVQLDTRTVTIAREWFATFKDVCLLTGHRPEDESDRDTADGRPNTIRHASQRIARMVCSDPDQLGMDLVQAIADSAMDAQKQLIANTINHVVQQNDQVQPRFVVSGEGDWLAREIICEQFGPSCSIQSLVDIGGPYKFHQFSSCAPAFSVARLLQLALVNQ